MNPSQWAVVLILGAAIGVWLTAVWPRSHRSNVPPCTCSYDPVNKVWAVCPNCKEVWGDDL